MKTTILIYLSMFITYVLSAPLQKSTDKRKGKSPAYFEFVQPDLAEYQNYAQDNEEYLNFDYEENELSRRIPNRKILPSKPFNSPIYYIRLPPQPYMFVPGLGYVSQQTQSTASQFLNLPVSFISNGKPDAIYQWHGANSNFPAVTQALPPSLTSIVPAVSPKPQPLPTKSPVRKESTIHRLTGKYVFNGKPNDIFVLGDSYNSIYGDALQNFYP